MDDLIKAVCALGDGPISKFADKIIESENLTAQQRFDQSVQHEIKRLIRQGEENYAKQHRDEFSLSFVESFTQWLDNNKDSIEFPGSFEEWLKQNNDAI